MKHVYQCIALGFMLCLSQYLFSQMSGTPFTATYEVELQNTHVLEKDKEGNVTKAINIIPGSGTHSLLGDVTTISIVHFDSSAGDNVIEFTETDADGNSLFVKTKGTPDKDGWVCHGAIMGGTGKYKTATGNYKAVGKSSGNISTFTAEGVLFYISEEDEINAIKKIIKAETKAFYNMDMEEYYNIQSAADYNGGIYVLEPGTAMMKRGKEFRQTIEAYPRPSVMPAVERSNWDIQVRGDVAWASFTQQTTSKENVLTNSFESRILEKINGEWKIVFNTVAFYEK